VGSPGMRDGPQWWVCEGKTRLKEGSDVGEPTRHGQAIVNEVLTIQGRRLSFLRLLTVEREETVCEDQGL